MLMVGVSSHLSQLLAETSPASVSFHGSWDRTPPTGYKVVKVLGSIHSSAWSQSAALNSTTGYSDILWNTDINACPGSCFRPTGMVWNHAGTILYVASDATGEVFALAK